MARGSAPAPRTGRRPLIAGNWKMHMTHLEAIGLTQKVVFSLTEKDLDVAEVVVLPPFTALRSVQTLVAGDKLAMRYGEKRYSYHDLAALMNRAGNMLRRFGVGPGDEILVAVSPSPSLVASCPHPAELVVGGLGGTGAWVGRDYTEAQRRVEHQQEVMAQAHRDYTEAQQAWMQAPTEQARKIEAIRHDQRQRQLKMVVTGPDTVQSGAPTVYQVRTDDLLQQAEQLRGRGRAVNAPEAPPHQ